VTEIATAAGVAEKTVYDHFPTKAQLVFVEDPDLLTGLLDAIGRRAAGVSVIEVVRAYLPERAGRLGQHRPGVDREAFRAMVLASSSLREHQRGMAARYETSLAHLLAQQTGTDPDAPEPYIVAVAVIGVLRAGFDTSADAGGPAHAINRALDLLATGLADYPAGAPGDHHNADHHNADQSAPPHAGKGPRPVRAAGPGSTRRP
jgi:AcrR family transcriptional regulator